MSILAQAHNQRSPTPLRLTPLDEELLLSCARYQYVTAAQWCRLFGDESKLRYVQRRSRTLAEHDYLIRLYLPRPARMGKGPSVFALGNEGRRFAESLGVRVPARFRRGDLLNLSPQHLAHSEGITDVLLAFDRLAHRGVPVEIGELAHERFLHEQRFKVRVPPAPPPAPASAARTVEVIPDAFVRVLGRLGSGRRRRFPLIVEVDRDTEQQRAFREKIAALHAFGTSSAFEQMYEARTFTVAFFVLAPRRDPAQRLAEVVEWTERELKQRGLAHDAQAFSFCALDPATTSPETLLLGDCWRDPFEHALHPLIDLAEDEGGV